MSCCNRDCNEGRDCPVRKVKPYPFVPTDMPVNYVPTWRDGLRSLAWSMLLATALLGALSLIGFVTVMVMYA